MATTATSKPTGPAITRDSGKFTFSWKIPSCKFDEGQQLQWRRKLAGAWEDWKNIGSSASIGKTVTSKQVTVSADNFWPKKDKELHQVAFRVRGKRGPKSGKSYGWSDWVVKKFDVTKPDAPEVSAALTSSNVCTFSWETKADSKSGKWFVDVEWESMLVENCTEKNGANLPWNSNSISYETGGDSRCGTGGANGSQPIEEDTALLAGRSFTRWFRARSRGPEGNSAWKYANHVYAEAKRATVTESSVSADASGADRVTIAWKAASPRSNPIDDTIVKYKIARPDPGLACPGGDDWTTVSTSKDTSGKDAASFLTARGLNTDECLFVRVDTVHDGVPTPGIPELKKIGNLADPTIGSVQTNDATHRATITAQNNSQVSDSFLVVVLRRSSEPSNDLKVGIIPHGSTTATVQCPSWDEEDIAFGVYACVGTYQKLVRADGADAYTVTEKMKSAATVWRGGAVPKAPDKVEAAKAEAEGTIHVSWNWTWQEADAAELSWSDHPDAWESTNEPSTYLVSNLYASEWNVTGLEEGKKWYVRVRLKKGETFGPYSDIKAVDLSAAPQKPILTLSQPVVQQDEVFTAYWQYVGADGTDQSYAELREARYSNGRVEVTDQVVKGVQTAQHADVRCPWKTGSVILLALQVTSGSGKASEWSDPVAIRVAEPVVAAITSHSLETVQVPVDGGETRAVLSLTDLPLRVRATGAGEGGTTLVYIERAADYQISRPDDSEFTGYEGETIARVSQDGEDMILIEKEDLIGQLDDGAPYRVWAIAQDSIGQTDAVYLDFEVHWEHQAIMPEGDEMLRGSVMEIRIDRPAGTQEGDSCDIYRLSADKPALIFAGAEFGHTYIDPYPAMGDAGGHRLVYKTKNGDYITANNEIAFLDLADQFNAESTIIDFAGEQVILEYNLSLSSAWKKEFTETKYLGGSIQGDWSPGVSRTGTVDGVLVTVKDDATIAGLRRLAEYPGICHVRTPDGSSFTADVQVSESRSYQSDGRKVSFKLSITRVDPEEMDGIELATWEEIR